MQAMQLHKVVLMVNFSVSIGNALPTHSIGHIIVRAHYTRLVSALKHESLSDIN
jgi:hypothetical protein